MVTSILDNDLYVFSVSYVFFKNYPDASGVMEFKDRNNTKYSQEFLDQLVKEFNKICSLKLTDPEFEYVSKNIPYIPLCYW